MYARMRNGILEAHTENHKDNYYLYNSRNNAWPATMAKETVGNQEE
jgi:hypothetical protein